MSTWYPRPTTPRPAPEDARLAAARASRCPHERAAAERLTRTDPRSWHPDDESAINCAYWRSQR